MSEPTFASRSKSDPIRDALDHIMRVSRQGISPTKRLDWIEIRARYALEGKPWSPDIRETPRDSVKKMEKDFAQCRADLAKALANHTADLSAAAVSELGRWIPVSEKLPDDDVSVMIALQGEHGEPVWIGFHDDAGWHSATDAAPLGDMVTHWKNIEAGPHG